MNAIRGERFWILTHDEAGDFWVDGVNGRNVSIGPEGSGTRALALQLIKRSGSLVSLQ